VQQGIPKSAFAGLETFTGPAVTKYGLDNVRAAYEEMVNFVFATGWNPSVIRKNSELLSRADFANAHSYMTPAFQKAFDATLAKVIRSDKAATEKLEHAVFFGVGGPDRALPIAGTRVVTDRSFSKASIAVDKSQGKSRLSMTFHARATIQMLDASGKRYGVPANRTVQYWLVRNVGANAAVRPFLIDSWAIRLAVAKSVPASQ
jgi:hypothetical protein